MNKTVNINLAGVFFHIDEDAYAKLQRYLSAIKSSFEGVHGEDEIITDIEARISELFSGKIKDNRQVIGMTELDEVISIMGQPEDYMVDDDIFEDNPGGNKKSRTRASRPGDGKKLYRDVDNAYIGGVSSGLGHYFGIDALWIRLALVLIVIAGVGFPIFLYFLLWVLVPEAATTADKLSMSGKAINIDNIQEKVKEGFENVSDAVKNVDYDAYGNKIKKGTQGFFGAIGDIIMFFLKIMAKIFGVIFIITGAAMVIGLFITLISAGTFDIFYEGGIAHLDGFVFPAGAPVWVTSLLAFFAIGIPFFFLFYLGLKILSSNLKSMPLTAKLTLLGLWLVSVIGLGVIGLREATEHSFSGKVTTEERLAITAGDTLTLKMRNNEAYDIPLGRSNNSVSRVNSLGEQVFVNRDVRLIVRQTQDSTAYFKVVKEADGPSFAAAKEEAGYVNYDYEITDNTLLLDGFFSSNKGTRYRDQEVEVILYMPERSTLFADKNTYSYHRNDSRYRDILNNGDEDKYLILKDGTFLCDTCTTTRSNAQEDEWQYKSSQEQDSTPDWEDDSAATQLIITNEQVRLSIGTLTTRNELENIRQQLRSDKNITMSYSGSEFTSRGRIKKLSLEVDCNDGYSGKTINWSKGLEKNDIGFMRDYSEGATTPFTIGNLN